MAQAKTHTPTTGMPAKGSGKTMRDAAVAKAPSGGGTKRIDRTKGGHLKRSSGSFSKYR